MDNTITKSHIPILEFAFLKMVYATSVYLAIEKGKIKPDYLDLPNGERLWSLFRHEMTPYRGFFIN